MDPKDIVRRGYDAVSYRYRADQEGEDSRPYHAWLDELLPELPAGSPILDLGCGCGVPVACRLAKDYAVTGVDLSPTQIERARRLVPGASFICQDMVKIDFPPYSFAAVLAFYSVIHVPLEEQPALLDKIYGWLRPGGLFLATLGHRAWTGTEDNWLDGGATMFWSLSNADTYRDWLTRAGFTIRSERFIPEGNGGFSLFLAKK